MGQFAIAPRAHDALLVVDVQRDFLPGGALAVPHGDEVVRPLNACAALFAHAGLPIFATRDCHPRDHCSFRTQGGAWPPHCVAGTAGAHFADHLQLPNSTVVLSKATRRDQEAYSGFAGTGLADRLRAAGVRRLWVGGLATDYCVLHTVLDALKAGFEVVALPDAMRAVDAAPGDGERALERMQRAGARVHTAALEEF